MESHRWEDSEGKTRVSWGVTCDNLEFPLGKGKAGGNNASSENSGRQNSTKDFIEIDPLSDEDMPF